MPDAAVLRLRSKINIDLVITELAILPGVNVRLFPSSPTHFLPCVYAEPLSTCKSFIMHIRSKMSGPESNMTTTILSHSGYVIVHAILLSESARRAIANPFAWTSFVALSSLSSFEYHALGIGIAAWSALRKY